MDVRKVHSGLLLGSVSPSFASFRSVTLYRNSFHVSVAIVSLLMIYAGCLGELAAPLTNYGGWGWNINQVSEQVLEPYIVPVAGAKYETDT